MSNRERVIFSSEEPRSVSEIGEFLVQLGEKFKTQGQFTLTRGDEQINVKPEGSAKLELKYEIEGAKHSFEVEIEWKPGSIRQEKRRVNLKVQRGEVTPPGPLCLKCKASPESAQQYLVSLANACQHVQFGIYYYYQ